MRVLVIGDVHGKKRWKDDIDEAGEVDKIIFIGDYVDSHDKISINDIADNLYDIIEFKLSNLKKVILLLGNHDMQYKLYPNFDCSGFNQNALSKYNKIFNIYDYLFQISYQYKNHLFTHAGVNKTWLNKYKDEIILTDNLSNDLNRIFKSDKLPILMEVGNSRRWMKNKNATAGPLWADLDETEDDLVDGYIQYVGHTHIKHFLKITVNENTSIHYVDNEEYTVGQHIFNLN